MHRHIAKIEKETESILHSKDFVLTEKVMTENLKLQRTSKQIKNFTSISTPDTF